MHFLLPLQAKLPVAALVQPKAGDLAGKWLQQQSEQHASLFTSSRRERLNSFSKIPFLVLDWPVSELMADRRDSVTFVDLDHAQSRREAGKLRTMSVQVW